MSPQVMTSVTGKYHPGISARLKHYQRYCITGESYPGLVKKLHGITDGILYQNIPPRTIMKLDRFEGRWYKRTRVTVELDNGKHLPAYVYRFLPHRRLTSVIWQYQRFIEKYQRHFIKHYKGFL